MSPPRPTHVFVYVAAVLGLGLLTTILIAWGSAVFAPREATRWRYNLVSTHPSGAGHFIAIYELRRPGMLRRSWSGSQPFATPDWYREMRGDALVMPASALRQDRAWGRLRRTLEHQGGAPDGMEDARGWPYLALWCGLDAAAIEGNAARPPVWGGIGISDRPAKVSRYRALPFMPIWSGMAANTLLFAGTWLLIVLAARAARGRHRHRRGRCAGCGYELRGLPLCPECGRRPSRARPRPSPAAT